MNITELAQHLRDIGLPVAYGEFVSTPQNPAPAPPFITYQFAYNNDFQADNYNYVDVSTYQVELYTVRKDPTIEKRVQDKLKELRLPYNKVESKIESEQIYQIIYDITLIGG